MQNFNYLVQGEHFQIRSWMEGAEKMCFQGETCHISETVIDTAKVAIDY